MTDDNSLNGREVFGGLIGGGIVAGFGIWMLIEPGKIAQADYGPGRGGGLMRLIDAVWGVPGGVALAVLGGLVLIGTASSMFGRSK